MKSGEKCYWISCGVTITLFIGFTVLNAMALYVYEDNEELGSIYQRMGMFLLLAGVIISWIKDFITRDR